jgi:hypothetical protein
MPSNGAMRATRERRQRLRRAMRRPAVQRLGLLVLVLGVWASVAWGTAPVASSAARTTAQPAQVASKAVAQIDRLLARVSLIVAADTRKLYYSKSAKVGYYPPIGDGLRNYVWAVAVENAPGVEPNCGKGADLGYVYYAAVLREPDGGLDFSNVHAVFLTSNTYGELLMKGPDKLIQGAQPSKDSWSVATSTQMSEVEASDDPEPAEIRLTLKDAKAVAEQDLALARRGILDEPLACPRLPFQRPADGSYGPIDLERIPVSPARPEQRAPKAPAQS